MISVAEEFIDRITATFHYLRTGKVPPSIPIPESLPDNEIRQLISYVNRFLVEFASFAEAMEQLAHGELNARPLLGCMAVVHAFKALQSNLRHLTWKTQQIAAGDLEQQVDFMGDFSVAFNSMTEQLKDSREQLVDLNQQLECRNRFIRETFGRYTSDEIVGVLLDMPEGLKLGGEKRVVTLLMSDLRGFTALVERLEATEVVAVLNHYLSVMVEIVHLNGGTTDEIIGDAIFVLFGAPLVMPDVAPRAVRCALEMQQAMREVNKHNLQKGWPEIEMGIALDTGEVVVGNIGSTKRSKYGVVGQAVNLTARIESFSVGGQVLVSPALIQAAGQGLILGDEVKVHAKGMPEALQCRELLGHEAHPELFLEETETSFTTLAEPLPFSYARLTGKHLNDHMEPGTLVRLSRRRAIVEVTGPLPLHTNIMLRLQGEAAQKDSLEAYAKVIHLVDESGKRCVIHFTSVSPGLQLVLGNPRIKAIFRPTLPGVEVLRVRFAQKYSKILQLHDNLCYLGIAGNRLQEKRLCEFYQAEEVGNPILGLRWPRLRQKNLWPPLPAHCSGSGWTNTSQLAAFKTSGKLRCLHAPVFLYQCG